MLGDSAFPFAQMHIYRTTYWDREAVGNLAEKLFNLRHQRIFFGIWKKEKNISISHAMIIC